jgi:predicted nucleic acid-binding protein
MVVVDCNVLAHLLIDGVETPRARALLEQDADWHSDALVLIELCNVLATAMRTRGLSPTSASAVLTQAQGVIDAGLHGAGHHETLDMAARHKVSAYDARYLVIARDLDSPLVTEDARLRTAAPKLTRSLATAVGY